MCSGLSLSIFTWVSGTEGKPPGLQVIDLPTKPSLQPKPRRIFLVMTFAVAVCRYEANTYRMFRNTLGSFAFHPRIPHSAEGGQLRAILSVRYILGPDCGQVATKCGFLMTKFWSFRSEQWIDRPGLCTEAMLCPLGQFIQQGGDSLENTSHVTIPLYEFCWSIIKNKYWLPLKCSCARIAGSEKFKWESVNGI